MPNEQRESCSCCLYSPRLPKGWQNVPKGFAQQRFDAITIPPQSCGCLTYTNKKHGSTASAHVLRLTCWRLQLPLLSLLSSRQLVVIAAEQAL